jgi:hypothetical protein
MDWQHRIAAALDEHLAVTKQLADASSYIGQRQGFWSKTHGCVVAECCRTLQPLSGCGNDSCTIHIQHIPPTAWAQGCLLNPSCPPQCNPLQIL